MNMRKRKIVGDSGCPSCIANGRDKTRNHLIHFDDGFKFCNRCGYKEGGNENHYQLDEEVQDYMDLESIKLLHSGEIPDRKIGEDAAKHYGVKLEYDTGTGQPVKHFYPITKDGVVTSYKVRELPKTFVSIGDAKGKVDLFGQSVTPAGGKKLLIVGGELDCLAAWQMFKEKYPNLNPAVVSLPKGENASSIKDNLNYINSFSEVIVYTDMDEVGRDTAKKIAKLIGPKAKIMSASEKDASDMLKAGKQKEFIQSFYSAEGVKPEGIVSGADVSIDRLRKATNLGYDTQYTELNKMLGGFRKGELTTLTAGSGIGKSTLSREIGWILRSKHNLTVGHIALEEKIEKTINGYIAIENNIPLNLLMKNPSVISDEVYMQSHSKLIAEGWYGFDHFGSMPTEDLMERFRYLAYGEGCDFIILDHLSLVFSGQDNDHERQAIDKAMTELAAFANESGVGVIVVVHLSRKPHKASFNEGGQVSLTDLRGSAALEQLSWNVIALERNQQGEGDEKNESVIRILKCRETGFTGVADTCYYSFDTGRLLPITASLTSDF